MKLHKDISNTNTIRRFETLESDFRKVHGDKYDYSLVEYKSVKDKVKIICKEHGVFEQSPNKHLKGQCCFKCSIISKSSNTQEFT